MTTKEITTVDPTTYNFKHCVEVQKRFDDLDPFAHINNCAQQAYFDIGRADYLGRLQKGNFFLADKVFLVVSYKTDFVRQITFEVPLEVCTSVYHVGNKSIRIIQVLRNNQSGEIHTTCDSVMAAVDIKQQKSIEVPQIWRDAIATLEA